MEKGTKRRVKKLRTAFFVLYVLVLGVSSVLFGRIRKSGGCRKRIPLQSCSVCGDQAFLDLSKIVGTFALFTNVFGNVLGFVPYGFILPVITGKCEMAFLSYYPAFYQSDDRSDPAAYKSWMF